MEKVKRFATKLSNLCSPNNQTAATTPSATSISDIKFQKKYEEEIYKQLYNLVGILNKFCDAHSLRQFIAKRCPLEKCCAKHDWVLRVLKQKCFLILEVYDNNFGFEDQETYIKGYVRDIVLTECETNNLILSKEDYISEILSVISSNIEHDSDKNYYDIDLSECDLRYVNLKNIRLHNVDLHYTDLSDTGVSIRNLKGGKNLIDANLTGAIYITSDPKFINYDPCVALSCINATINDDKLLINDVYLGNLKLNLKFLYIYLERLLIQNEEIVLKLVNSKLMKLILEIEYDFVEIRKVKLFCEKVIIEEAYAEDQL